MSRSPTRQAPEITESIELSLALQSVMAYVTHEINHPLGTIANLAGVLSRCAELDVQPRELIANLETIKAEARRAAVLLKNMRTSIGLIPAGRTRLAFYPIVLTALERTKARLRAEQAEHILIEVECSDKTVTLSGIGFLLEIALYNLMINSVEALGNSRADSQSIMVRVRARDGMIDATITDTGPGVHKDISGRVFDPFVTTKPGRSGLGLAITRDIVASHGGSIIYITGRNSARFNVLLPSTK